MISTSSQAAVTCCSASSRRNTESLRRRQTVRCATFRVGTRERVLDCGLLSNRRGGPPVAFRWEVGGSPPNPFPLEWGAPRSIESKQGSAATRHMREAPRALFFALSLLVLLAAPARAQEPRFGDTTWVAPHADSFHGEPSAPGPRVAEPEVERGWEKALRAPFRVVFYPVRLLARGSQAAVGFGSKFIN